MHCAAALGIWQCIRHRISPATLRRGFFNSFGLLCVVGFFSMLPDCDAVGAMLFADSGEFGNWHNQGTHSLISGLAVALVAVVLALLLRRGRKAAVWWGAIVLLSYALHVILDFCTRGRGVMLLWPFSEQRFKLDPPIFMGVHWSEGFISFWHILTALQEFGIAIALGLTGWLILHCRSPKD